MDDRAATETLGMVLLLALVILLATTIGLGLLAQTSAIQDGTERSYLNVDPDLNASALTLTHAGGPSFQTSNLTLVLQNEAGTVGPYRLDNATLSGSGLSDGSFDTGDSVTVGHPFSGFVDISLYSPETDERLYRAVISTDQSQISTPSSGSGPTAQIAALDQVAEGYSITLDGSGSSDPDGSIDDYQWKIKGSGNGSIIDDTNEVATYKAPSDIDGDENVTIQLTVTDNDGNTAKTEKVIRVVDFDTAEVPGDGDAFDDVNGNGIFDEAETNYTKEDLEDGFNEPDVDLVIYPSVGEIRTNGNKVDITAKTITAGSDFRANGDSINLTAEGDIRIDGVTLDSNKNNGITITSMNGRIFANGTTMEANNGPIELNSNGSIYLESADLDAGSYNADLTVTSSTLYVDQATIGGNGNNAGTLFYTPENVTVNGSPDLGTVASQ